MLSEGSPAYSPWFSIGSEVYNFIRPSSISNLSILCIDNLNHKNGGNW